MNRTKRLEPELAMLRERPKDPAAWRQFVGATREDWERMAADIFRAWSLPPGVDAEDVRQELLLAVYAGDLVSRWNPQRQGLAKFVVWNAYVEGKRFVHRQRAALRRDGKAPSRFPLAFSSLGKLDGLPGDELGLEGVAAATQEDDVASSEMAAGIRQLLGSARRRVVFDVLRRVGGNTAAAAREIWATPRLGIACRVGSEREAAALVDDTLEAVERVIGEVLAA